MPFAPTPRRPLLKAFAGGVVTLGAASGVTATATGANAAGLRHPGILPHGTALALRPHGASDVNALDIRLGDDLLPRVANGRWVSGDLPATTHSMVALTWRRTTREPHIHISSRTARGWGPWRSVHHLHDEPDAGTPERTDVAGTELVWVGAADGIRVHVAGARPRDLTLVLLHPGHRADDKDARPDEGGPAGEPHTSAESGVQARRTTADRRKSAPQPTIFSRKTWGADESWRDGSPRYNTTLRQVHVHHTVNSNDYARADVPALMRGMYRYHTYNLGWSDIGYNFVVDRFGRIWTGRAGGNDRLVRGAHTLGFNSTSAGISVIGNYDLVSPSSPTLDAIARVAAWKLSLYGRDPQGRTDVVSEGSDKFGSGRTANLPVLDGHRDTNDTACPGQKLYDRLPELRTRTAAIIDGAQQSVVTVTTAATLDGPPAVGSALGVVPGSLTPSNATSSYSWLRDGVVLDGVTTRTYTPSAADRGTQLSVRVLHRQSGYRSATETLVAAGVVKQASTTAARSVGRSGRAVIHVAVTTVDGSVPVGQVTVQVNHRSKTVELANGAVVARFIDFTPRTYAVTVTYLGSETLAVSRTTGTVQVT